MLEDRGEKKVIAPEQVSRILLPLPNRQEILQHCERKLAGNYLPGESRDRRACGLLAGVQMEHTLNVKRIMELRRNVREQEPYKTYMDRIMNQYAVPSKTPLSQRGWITDPVELKECCDGCDKDNLIILGTYHTHIVPWEHDPVRDTPTRLDTVLARNSNLFSFIVSMVHQTRPIIRAFYEGSTEKETLIVIQDNHRLGTN